ncbi:hypothetical protein B7494_g2580 [Chlorociboria aeruginascens]|nr:hypothetical protein B7494_g2580 [Chlorociboria aeruginascens]
MISLTQQYDAFEDLPWALVYQDMASLYPDAKFILTLRENEMDWLESIKVHTARRKWIGHSLIYGGMRAKGNEQAYLDVYREHASSVREFFEAEGDGTRLLEITLDGKKRENKDEGETWRILLKFLDMEASDEVIKELGDFPWSNRTADFMGLEIMKNLAWFWDRFMFYIEEALLGAGK